MVGGLPEEVAASRDLTKGEEVGSRIEFAGYVEPWRVQDYLTRARVGVCPLDPDVSIISERFTSPLKLLEMMAHGVPVVASDVPSTRSIVTHGETAWLVSPGILPPWPAASGHCSTTGRSRSDWRPRPGSA